MRKGRGSRKQDQTDVNAINTNSADGAGESEFNREGTTVEWVQPLKKELAEAAKAETAREAHLTAREVLRPTKEDKAMETKAKVEKIPRNRARATP